MKSLIASVLALFVGVSVASADITMPKQDNPITKLGRGVANLVTGPTHVIDCVLGNIETEGVTYAWTTGLAYGIWRSGADMAHGAFDVLTFPIPVGPGLTYQTWKQPPIDSMVVRENPPGDLNAYYIY